MVSSVLPPVPSPLPFRLLCLLRDRGPLSRAELADPFVGAGSAA